MTVYNPEIKDIVGYHYNPDDWHEPVHVHIHITDLTLNQNNEIELISESPSEIKHLHMPYELYLKLEDKIKKELKND